MVSNKKSIGETKNVRILKGIKKYFKGLRILLVILKKAASLAITSYISVCFNPNCAIYQ